MKNGATSVRKSEYGKFCSKPCSDPTESHVHLWKRAELIDFVSDVDSSGKETKYEQNPQCLFIEKKIPIDPKAKYCCICHAKSPPLFKMKTTRDDHKTEEDWCVIYNDETRFMLDNENKNHVDLAIIARSIQKLELKSEDAVVVKPKKRKIEDDVYNQGMIPTEHEEMKLKYMNVRKKIRDAVNTKTGELQIPSNTSRNIMVGNVQRRPKLRRKASIFLPPYNNVRLHDENLKVLFTKRTGKYLTQKKKKVQLINTEKKYLEVA